jgi:hypothetical protein
MGVFGIFQHRLGVNWNVAYFGKIQMSESVNYRGRIIFNVFQSILDYFQCNFARIVNVLAYGFSQKPYRSFEKAQARLCRSGGRGLWSPKRNSGHITWSINVFNYAA